MSKDSAVSHEETELDQLRTETSPKLTNVKDNEEEGEEGSVDVGACSLCHCALDYSDRAAFFKLDREEDYDKDHDGNDDDEFFFRRNDPYLPEELYDKANALVYCDDCDRMYHQKCHFVPLIVVPRGKWSCLLCQSVQKMKPQPTSKKQSTKKQPTSFNDVENKTKSKKRGRKPKAISRDDTKVIEATQNDWPSIVRHVNDMFRSPPVAAAKQWEQKWEYAARQLKAALWKTELTQRLKQASATQGTNHRQAYSAILTLSSTRRNRNHHFGNTTTGPSQEIAQSLVKLYGARLQWREMCFSLDSIRRSTDANWHVLHEFVRTQQKTVPDFIQRVIFPFGKKWPRRSVPRTAEMAKALQEQTKTLAIPAEIVLNNNTSEKPSVGKHNNKKQNLDHNARNRKSQRCILINQDKKQKEVLDNNSGISLENLQCCVCHACTSTDENDLVMCDGDGCYRAYHMKCVEPELTQAQVEEDDDWFCPICTALAKLMNEIQVEYMGDEWEQERNERAYYGKGSKSKRFLKLHEDSGVNENSNDNDDDDDDDSYKSWGAPKEVFPTAAQDYGAALQMKQGKRNKATDDLLARILGLDQLPDHDDDDEVEDGHFDLDSFQGRRQKKKSGNVGLDKEEDVGDEEDDDSSHSSRATLVEMSSVELEIGQGELDALSGGSWSDGDQVDADNGQQVGQNSTRRSRRLRNMSSLNQNAREKKSSKRDEANAKVEDLGFFDKANIVEGKRGRKPVDYIQLNEDIFGNMNEQEAADLDDADEFVSGTQRQPRTRRVKNMAGRDNDVVSDCIIDKCNSGKDGEDNHNDISQDEEDNSVEQGSRNSDKEPDRKSNQKSTLELHDSFSKKGQGRGRRKKSRPTSTAKLTKIESPRTVTAIGDNRTRPRASTSQPPTHPFSRLNGVICSNYKRRKIKSNN